MNVLEGIIASKEAEVSQRKKTRRESVLTSAPLFSRKTVSLKEALTKPGSSGIIAEIKRKSPSKGVLNNNVSASELAAGYFSAGAAAISVLTDSEYFGGSLEDLESARAKVPCPLLRKDFLIDEYQVLEAKAAGADAVLLIAAVNPPGRSAQLCRFAHETGLEVLLEFHSPQELALDLVSLADAVDINNRDLTDFSVDINRCLSLAAYLPRSSVKVAESGLDSSSKIALLRRSGFCGFLLGEFFMRSTDPAKACRQLISELKELP